MVLPLLANAAVGQFDRDVPEIGRQPRELNELLMGIQVLLETIREQRRELEETRERTSDILTEVLERFPEAKSERQAVARQRRVKKHT